MPEPIHVDLRRRVVATYLAGGATQEAVAERFKVGIASVKRWLRKQREGGDLSPRPKGGHWKDPLVGDGDVDRVRELVEDLPDATLATLAVAYAERTGVTVSKATMGRAMRRADITRKKKPSQRPSATGAGSR